MKAVTTDEEFVSLFETVGPAQIAKRYGIDRRGVQARRNRLEKKWGRLILSPRAPLNPGSTSRIKPEAKDRITWRIKDGYVLVGSDAHYWPGIVTTAHKAFVKFAKDLKPQIIIKNGDALDGSSISRHAPIGWEKHPTLVEEIEACKDRLGEIIMACPKAKRAWPLGNHDARFETRLASVAPEFAKIHGIHLKDHFPEFEPCWSVWLNDDVVVKHRFRGGIHAVHNNVLWAGKTMITGHLHSAKVSPFDDYNGTRWGVDCGTMSEPYGPQFNYLEDNPRNWRSAFCVLRFKDWKLMQPQLALVAGDGLIDYCNEVIRV